MGLKNSPDYIDSKYILVHVSNFLGQVFFFSDILFWLFLALHRIRKRCGQVEPSPCYSQSKVEYVYQVLELLLQGFSLKKHHFFYFSHYHGNHFLEFFCPCFKLVQNQSSCQSTKFHVIKCNIIFHYCYGHIYIFLSC